MRVALAGSLKAGKSTLLNALVGQDIAPTDATECTRVVTWYRAGSKPSVVARYDADETLELAVLRRDGRLTFDMGGMSLDRVSRIEVTWPTSDLARHTIIDTPGTSSLSADVSARTLDLLAPEGGGSGADAVVYLMKTLADSDLRLLEKIGAGVGGSDGPLGVIGVLSRADEVGAGRIDAMTSARQVADRLAGELLPSGVCQAMIPVAGLLALGARTLRQNEFAALQQLSTLPGDQFEGAMLSADRFVRPDLLPTVDPRIRAVLADRLGLFGIRLSVSLIGMGVRDASTLADELVQRSGLNELRAALDTQFGQRADVLKTHSAVRQLLRILEPATTPRAASIRAEASAMLADSHDFRELRLLGRIRSVDCGLGGDEIADLVRLIGGEGVGDRARLGLAATAPPDAVHAAALAQIQRWRSRADHPLLDEFAARACRVGARSAEGVLAYLSQGARN
jgi:hypothetical protein